MKILSLVTSFTGGGAETLVVNLSGAFVAEGHSSTVVALSAAAAVGNDPAMERRLRERVEDAGGGARLLGEGYRRNLAAGAVALRRLVAAERPDVIHAHTARALLMLWLGGVRRPVVFTHHNSRLSFPPALFRLFDRIVSTYVAISADCARQFAGHVRRPIATVMNAAGGGFLAPEPRRAARSPATLLAVGALSDQKNYPLMIDAAARLQALRGHARPFRLAIAGGGPADALNDMIHATGAPVDLLGSRDDIPALTRAADLFLNSSRYEGLPIAVIEALQAGLPVIATDVSGTRELIRDGREGLLVEAGDAAAFAAAIDRALSDPALYAALSEQALRTGGAFGMEGCARAHLGLYREALGHRRAGTTVPAAAAA